jgi:hypothetical protein
VGAHHVDDILVDLIETWGYTYLQEMARRSGEDAGQLVPFRNYRVTYEMEHMPEDQTPTCIIANRGLTEHPMRRNFHRPGQSYKVVWNYQIGAHVSAKGKKVNASPRAQRLAKMYVGAIRNLLIQKRDDSGLLGMIDWMDENYDGLTSDSDRTICLAYAEFNVEAYEVATWGTGPMQAIPEPDPPDPDIPYWPTVSLVIPEIIKIPTDQEIPDS